MFFQLFSTIKVKSVDKMMQSTYLCVVLQVKRKQLFVSPGRGWISNS